jgi:phosphoribosylformimino-5-aminoimidazole carboxamide ribotide isomerase
VQLIPAIDLREGRCVRLYQGDFDRQTVYSDSPAEVAKDFQRMGLGALHLVDLDGARQGSQNNSATIREIADNCDLAIQLGGGIRDTDTLGQWLSRGIRRCVIGSLAVLEPDRVCSWFGHFGSDCIVLALDVRLGDDGEPRLATDGWTRTSDTTLWDCIDTYREVGLCRVLCTDISRDGALSGPNVELYRKVLKRYPGIELQASGGIRHADDLRALRDIGVHAAIAGRALLDGRISDQEVVSFLQGE